MAAQFVVVQYSSKIPLSLFALSYSVAEKNKDVQLIDFVEIEFLAEQVSLDLFPYFYLCRWKPIRKISEYFAQLRTLHKGHEGGYGSGQGQMPHLATTYAAINALITPWW
ncbi:ferritin-3, chloroplastic-like [Pyrus x bretschneideri]|uniref:ferritin-3, chloroplastic-like n=1 Tax=Pyrus x bretschneideri TaxID=225117 RepID=UPI0020306380|nr:ferritin-3, chloroplastic-like [Pyrus x bretschneideri]XP_048422553.1 ferritin-3, chloroplastic-like [Pyrus x bretschneideri]